MVADVTIHLSDKWVNNCTWFLLGVSYGLIGWTAYYIWTTRKKNR